MNCKGALLVEGFLHNLCLCFDVTCVQLGCDCAVTVTHSFKLTAFFQNKSGSQEISYLLKTTRPWFHACIHWKIVCYLTVSVAAIHFLRHFHYFTKVFEAVHSVWKVSKYEVISGLYFPVFGLQSEIYGVNIRIQSEYRKIWTRNNYVFGQFSRGERNCVYFTTLIETIHYLKWTVVDSK